MAVKQYFVYWIVSGRSSYIGATVDPTRRLRQHCGLTTGGARRTRGKLWTYKCVVSGFRTWHEALCYEWSFKFHSKRCRSIESRKLALEELMRKERWTSNSPLASEVPLTIEYDPVQYGMPPEKLPFVDGDFQVGHQKKGASRQPVKKSSRRTPRKGEAATKKYKKRLHGVTY